MINVRINASTEYEVLIGEGLLADAGMYINRAVSDAKTLAVISDSNVYPTYGARVEASLTDAGFDVITHVIKAGEEHKNLETYGEILSVLSENRLGRNDAIIALGGGVVGDLAGFAAATYMRGIRYVQIPTTLLAAVDSSVGGKTAIDLPTGKNLAGAFHQPSLVLCDTETLETLTFDAFRDGCAEVIKYAVLADEEMFESLMEVMVEENIEDVIAACISMKRDFVMADEFDRGQRMLLNLGHTLGHAVEKLSDYGMSHGKAVAIGMNMIARAAMRHGICTDYVPYMIESICEQYSLPTETDFAANEIAKAALTDKKATGNSISLVVPEEIGRCRIIKVKLEDLDKWCV